MELFKQKILKSPIHYTGNKLHLIKKINNLNLGFDIKLDSALDLFSGSGTIGINLNAKEVFFIDSNKKIINLLKFLCEAKKDYVLKNVTLIITQYKLTNSSLSKPIIKVKLKSKSKNHNNGFKDLNSEGYYKLRNDYNKIENKNSNLSNLMLLVLSYYSFNNDIRFNSKGDFNLPVGKTDFNQPNLKRLIEFLDEPNKDNFNFICSQFDSKESIEVIGKVDLIYIDPPYILTNAVYNEETKWDIEKEERLIKILDILIELKKPFIFSNILNNKNAVNIQLESWTNKNSKKIKVYDIEYNYRKSSYNKINRDLQEREVIIVYYG
jgi:site-specific DNA-adenine methylase